MTDGKSVIIIGGGAAGVQAALEQAKAGKKVYLVGRQPSLASERILPDGDLKADSQFSTAPMPK
ncbi:MAG: FAD-dependent oxidoreductase [Chloroflexi bacterium]|nr:FAD-dependent oxidoreductase [Chloroflexota bacterium]